MGKKKLPKTQPSPQKKPPPAVPSTVQNPPTLPSPPSNSAIPRSDASDQVTINKDGQKDSPAEDTACQSQATDVCEADPSVKVVATTDPEHDAEKQPPIPAEDKPASPLVPTGNNTKSNSWADLVKGNQKPLMKKGVAFMLESGEPCVRKPNTVIENHRKAWDCFILGQFYSNPPSQGTIHSIVNGIWSKHFRYIVVSKMEGNSFLFRVPNAATRRRILTQRLWQIQGQTMFVATWEPGVAHIKPELTSAPIWLELRNVPLQFFHAEGLEHIAGLVGEPQLLHPTTENKTNLEVAKVLTLIDPRKPLPEAVNVQFESGQISRIKVSSPWMPPICSHCKEVGHSLKHCRKAPVLCVFCSSTAHKVDRCPKASLPSAKSKNSQQKSLHRYVEEQRKRVLSKEKEVVMTVWKPKEVGAEVNNGEEKELNVILPDQLKKPAAAESHS